MGFYEQISKYYDYIFPVGEEQLEFIKQSTGQPVKRVLDVACGTGGYAIELAKSGYEVIAVDIENEMIETAKNKAKQEGIKVDFLKCDMREFNIKLKGSFYCIFCIGNSIAHLGNKEEISDVIGQMFKLLNENGTLILQIINYDRVLKYSVSELPTLQNPDIGLEFSRRYEYHGDRGVIDFNTMLTIQNGSKNEKFENSIPLLPLLSKDMLNILGEAGFSKIKFYGDFKYSEYNENSFMLVAKANK